MTLANIRPEHYKNGDRSVEIIEMIRPMPFGLGNAIKYIFRCRRKKNKGEDLTKAIWYIEDTEKNKDQYYSAKDLPNFVQLSDAATENMLSANDDFEKQTILEIYDAWVKNTEFIQVTTHIQREINKYSA